MAGGKRYQAYVVNESEEVAGRPTEKWTKAGSGWVNRDGSMNVYLDVLPMGGKLVLREAPAATRDAATELAAAEAV